MIKKLSASLFALALVASVFAPAQAQDWIAIYGDTGSGLSRAINTTPGVPFDIVVQNQTDNTSAAAEFVIDDVKVLFPSVFRLSITKVNNTPLDLGDNTVGEYLIAYGVCLSAGTVEIVRINYGDFGGAITNDVVLGIRGLQPGDSRPSSFNGSTGYVDCTNAKHPMTLEPFPAPDVIGVDPTKLVGVDSGDGVCVLNADVTPNETASVGTLKGRF